jgi:hypothetical protein
MNVYVFLAGLFMCSLLIFKISGSFIKSFFTSIVGGLGAICAVGAISYFIPLSLGVNLCSLIFSALFSVPGVVFLLLSQIFLF